MTPNSPRSTTASRALLICPPFQSPLLSSISAALLAGHLRRHGVPCEEAYLHLDLLALLGRSRYDAVNDTANGRLNGQTAELLFSEGLHGPITDSELAAALTALIGDADERRRLRDAYAEQVRARVADERPDLVGITTSFNQLTAALWMTPIIKQVVPEAVVVLGGTACAAPMGQGIADAYPDVDYVVSGPGEAPLLRLARGERPAGRLLSGEPLASLDDAPLPDYRRFQREMSVYAPDIPPLLVFQTSTGCWWGAKRHCTFCGLNGEGMAYKEKSVERAMDDIRTLWERHRTDLVATDCILSRSHLRELLPELARFRERPTLYYEMKANLTEADIIAMKAAAIRPQVGIESLSTRLLKLMQKGVSSIQALALLKWCREQRIDLTWNQLCRIPGERVEDYDEQIALMAKIPHFVPPGRVNPVVIDRYSPYFERYEQYGWEGLVPISLHRAAHPHLDPVAQHSIAYHFDGVGGVSADAYIDRLRDAVAAWQDRHAKKDGLYWDRYSGLARVTDRSTEQIHVNDQIRQVIEATHTITHRARVMEQTGCDASLLDEMIENGFLYEEKSNLINLTVRHSR